MANDWIDFWKKFAVIIIVCSGIWILFFFCVYDMYRIFTGK